jgi:hypothetical protein
MVPTGLGRRQGHSARPSAAREEPLPSWEKTKAKGKRQESRKGGIFLVPGPTADGFPARDAGGTAPIRCVKEWMAAQDANRRQ